MLKKLHTKFVSFLAVATLAGVISGTWPVSAYIYSGRPNCPWYSPSHTWAAYLSGQYGDKEPAFSIKFDKTIGTVTAGQCYTIAYLGGGAWGASGWNGVLKRGQYFVYAHQDTVPDKYLINLWGAPLHFNEGGEVCGGSGFLDSRIS
jgi:hypothetical protein